MTKLSLVVEYDWRKPGEAENFASVETALERLLPGVDVERRGRSLAPDLGEKMTIRRKGDGRLLLGGYESLAEVLNEKSLEQMMRAL